MKELRAKKNVSQADVAIAMGISRQTYSEWEKDIGRVPVRKVDRLAEYFGVGLDDIFLP